MNAPLTPRQATKIWNVLFAYAGASGSGQARNDFINSLCDPTANVSEYRFQGFLGFGGKFWNCNDKWSVSCYREDETPGRISLILHVNALLAEYRASEATVK